MHQQQTHQQAQPKYYFYAQTSHLPIFSVYSEFSHSKQFATAYKFIKRSILVRKLKDHLEENVPDFKQSWACIWQDLISYIIEEVEMNLWVDLISFSMPSLSEIKQETKITRALDETKILKLIEAWTKLKVKCQSIVITISFSFSSRPWRVLLL